MRSKKAIKQTSGDVIRRGPVSVKRGFHGEFNARVFEQMPWRRAQCWQHQQSKSVTQFLWNKTISILITMRKQYKVPIIFRSNSWFVPVYHLVLRSNFVILPLTGFFAGINSRVSSKHNRENLNIIPLYVTGRLHIIREIDSKLMSNSRFLYGT